MAISQVQKLKKYFKYLEDDKAHWVNGIWKDITENLIPYREDLTGTQPKGSRKARKIYDSSPSIYLNIFADGLHGNMINPAIQWFVLRLPRHLRFLEDVPEVRQYLQDYQEELYYAFQNSNFYSAKRQFFKDGGSIGTAMNFIEEDRSTGKLVFHVIHCREFNLAENKHGKVDVVVRKLNLTARIMEQMFGKDKLTQPVQNALTNNPFTEFEVINCVYPNDEFDKRRIGSKYKKYASKWFEFNVPDSSDIFLNEKGFDELPYKTWRYFRGDRPPYGDSPAVFALPEIMGLQAISKSLLRAGHLAADPAYNIPAEQRDNTHVYPGGHNYYGPDFQRKITPINSGIDFPVALDREDRKRDILKEHYHTQFFLMLQNAERQMTAEEVVQRMGEKATVLAASIGDLTVNLDEEIDYVAEIEGRAGRLPNPPDILLQYMQGQRIPVEYMGPLAQVQRRLFETRGIRDSLEIAAPYMEIEPSVSDIINHDKTFKNLLISYGFPQDNFNDPNTIKEIREGRAIQEQEELKKVDMERFADILKTLAMADKQSGGKMAEAIENVMAGTGVS